jgi:hypothetical protein
MALQGDPRALRICMERISPARQDACIQLSLPSIRTAQDVEKAAEKVTQAIRRGKITPLEGGKIMSILESRSRILEGCVANRKNVSGTVKNHDRRSASVVSRATLCR